MSSVNSPTIYFLDKGTPAGFEYELAQAFAQHHNLTLDFKTYASKQEALEALHTREAQLSAAHLIVTPDRQAEFSFAPEYLSTTSALIYRITQGRQPPQTLDDLAEKRLVVAEQSAQLSVLESLKVEHPDLSWEVSEELSDYEILEKIQARDEIDLSVMDSLLFNTFGPYLPGIKIAFEVTDPQPISWAFLSHPDQSLQQALDQFFALASTQTLITQLKTKYFTQENPLGFFDTQTFNKHIKTRLPALLPDFLKAQEATGIDWHLLAAVAYQESHWNPKAVSPTGVRGIMMLTNATAKEMGVSDRTAPDQSIRGGAAYLKKTLARIPDGIQGEDRVWFALASYNIGFGHLEDARILTQRAQKNPNSWEDVRQFLPKLTQAKYYNTVKRGYARGHEPVHYVANIQKYIELIEWHEQIAQMQEARDAASAEQAIDKEGAEDAELSEEAADASDTKEEEAALADEPIATEKAEATPVLPLSL